jgi:excisionase family DNA binding protein
MKGNYPVFTTITVDELKSYILEGLRSILSEFKRPQEMNKDEKLLSLSEASEFLKVSKVTIHKWKKKKLITSYRIGRRIYFKKEELVNSLKSLNQKGY